MIGQHQARKRFGQNFLTDLSVIDRIINVIGPKPEHHLVEIGPGLGAITKPLLEACKQLDVVELDRDVIPKLERLCKESGELTVHSADALKFDFATLNQDARLLRIVGNLPYNISTPLLFRLLEQSSIIQDMHFMLQKEVVQRMAAGPGENNYGRLSVMLQYRCKVESIFEIGAEAFEPPPKVDSAFVRLVPYTKLPVVINDEQRFAELVRESFSQRRKTLRNNLRRLLSAEAITAAGVDPGVRPETLGLAEFAALSNALETQGTV